MPGSLYSPHDAEMRVYSNTDDGAGGKYYFYIPFTNMDEDLPQGITLAPETLQLDRGVANARMGYVQGSDVEGFQPQPGSFSVRLNDQERDDVYAAIGNTFRATPWIVGTKVWEPVTDMGTRPNQKGLEVTMPLPKNSVRRNSLIDLYVKYPGGNPGANDFVMQYKGCCPVWPFRTRPAGDVVNCTINIVIYGAIRPVDDFPLGTDTML